MYTNKQIKALITMWKKELSSKEPNSILTDIEIESRIQQLEKQWKPQQLLYGKPNQHHYTCEEINNMSKQELIDCGFPNWVYEGTA